MFLHVEFRVKGSAKVFYTWWWFDVWFINSYWDIFNKLCVTLRCKDNNYSFVCVWFRSIPRIHASMSFKQLSTWRSVNHLVLCTLCSILQTTNQIFVVHSLIVTGAKSSVNGRVYISSQQYVAYVRLRLLEILSFLII